MSRIACIDCKFCEYRPLSEEEKEEFYEADRKYYDSIKELSVESQCYHTTYRRPAGTRIRMQEYKCLHYKTEFFDNLSGKLSVSVGIDCKTYRDDPWVGHCGANAKFFQSKTKVIPIINQPAKVEPKKEQPQTVKEYLKALWKEIKEDV